MYHVSRKNIKNCWRAAKQVKLKTGQAAGRHFIDSIWCNVRYGCEAEQYASGDFDKMKSYDRKDTYTVGRSYELRKLVNNSPDMHYLSNKRDFNTYFSSYIKRDWISCENCDLESLNHFVTNHERIIVKPIGGMKGKGIYELDKSNRDSLIDLLGKKFLLEECISSHPLLAFNN